MTLSRTERLLKTLGILSNLREAWEHSAEDYDNAWMRLTAQDRQDVLEYCSSRYRSKTGVPRDVVRGYIELTAN